VELDATLFMSDTLEGGGARNMPSLHAKRKESRCNGFLWDGRELLEGMFTDE
jgi:hypothetical protein